MEAKRFSEICLSGIWRRRRSRYIRNSTKKLAHARTQNTHDRSGFSYRFAQIGKIEIVVVKNQLVMSLLSIKQPYSAHSLCRGVHWWKVSSGAEIMDIGPHYKSCDISDVIGAPQSTQHSNALYQDSSCGMRLTIE